MPRSIAKAIWPLRDHLLADHVLARDFGDRTAISLAQACNHLFHDVLTFGMQGVLDENAVSLHNAAYNFVTSWYGQLRLELGTNQRAICCWMT